MQIGRLNEAIAETKLSLELDPLSLDNNDTLGVEFFLARQYDQAIEQEGRVLELDPTFIGAYYFRGESYLKRSMYREGMVEFEKGVAISPVNTEALTGLGYSYAVTGRRAGAQKVLDELNGLSNHEYVSPVWKVKIYAGLKEKDKAFEWLEKAYEDRSIVSVGFIKTNPMFDPLALTRATPIFSAGRICNHNRENRPPLSHRRQVPVQADSSHITSKPSIIREGKSCRPTAQ